jgi:hypothetical protein
MAGVEKDPGVKSIRIGTAEVLPVVSAGKTHDLVPLAWHFTRVAEGGRRLVITIPDVTTARVKGAQVTETAQEVTVAVYGVARPRGPRRLPLHTVIASVQLAAPLGARRLLGERRDEGIS